MYQFEKVSLSELDESQYNSIPNKSVYTTIPWIKFILEDNPGAVPVIISIKRGTELIGFFTGAMVKKLGIKIIGSPFSGWSTCYMGLDVNDVSLKAEILEELRDFLFASCKCLYIELKDRDLDTTTLDSKYRVKNVKTLELNINRTDEELIKSFKNDCKYSIRQFAKRGARLEIAEPDDKFAEEYYEQLIDVFAKQKLVPTYSLEKVKRLLKNLKKSGEVLCLRVCDPEGKCIATSIHLGYNKKFFFWGGASFREGQHYRPNEYMLWYAIQYWRDKGVDTLDMMGVRPYKLKFNPEEVEYPLIITTRFKFLITLRDIAERLFYKWEQLEGWLKKRK